MGAITDLWKSERGLIAVALIAAATALCGLSVITVQQWLDYTKWIFVTYAAAKTITGSVGIVAAQPDGKPGWSQMEPLVIKFLSAWAQTDRTAQASVPSDTPKPASAPAAAPIAIVPEPPKAS